MKRFTIRLPEKQIEALDKLEEKGVIADKSEAIRAGLREWLLQEHYVRFWGNDELSEKDDPNSWTSLD